MSCAPLPLPAEDPGGQSREGRENIPTRGTSHAGGERIYWGGTCEDLSALKLAHVEGDLELGLPLRPGGDAEHGELPEQVVLAGDGALAREDQHAQLPRRGASRGSGGGQEGVRRGFRRGFRRGSGTNESGLLATLDICLARIAATHTRTQHSYFHLFQGTTVARSLTDGRRAQQRSVEPTPVLTTPRAMCALATPNESPQRTPTSQSQAGREYIPVGGMAFCDNGRRLFREDLRCFAAASDQSDAELTNRGFDLRIAIYGLMYTKREVFGVLSAPLPLLAQEDP
eukprot:1177502-Prorocentrum_minimum.AAC.2